MAYPAFPQGSRSSTDMLDGVSFDRASNGSVRGRSMWPASKRVFKVEHTLDSVALEELYTFYEANKTSTFDFTWAGDKQTYSVVLKKMSPVMPLGGALLWKVSVELEEA